MVVGSTSERLIRWLDGKKWDVICEERGPGGEVKPGCDPVGEK